MMDSSQEADFKAQKVKGFAKGLVARKMTDHGLELGSVTNSFGKKQTSTYLELS